jgi:predicted TPR repeat methyltransferase
MPVWDLVEVAETYGTDRPIAMAAATATVEESDMVEKAPGVLFNRVAREWRCKWSADDDQASLVAAQKVLDKHLAALKSLDGVEVQRVVCGGCKDFKVVTSVPAADFGAWENAAHAPEAEFLAELEAIDGISQVETQTYTFQTLEAAPVPDGPLQEKAPGVMFNRVAREWRCKWSDDKDSASLVEAQQVIDELLPQLRALPGAQVQRVVCGGCKDLKVITSVPAENFAAWQEVRFKPEENFLNEVTSIRGITQVEVQTYTLQSLTGPVPPGSPEMNEKAKGVYFNRVAREWRCKWSPDDDEASLVAAQKLLEKYLPKLEAMEGVQVQRVVCGGCKDFKIMTSVPADAFGGWMDAEFAPEAEFLEELKAIPGISQVETQMFTLQPLDGTPVVESEMKEKAPGVLFNRVAREWRCKWSDDNNDASLVAAQKVLDAYLPALTARTGARVQRVVCGGCKDFKVVTSVPADDFGVWMDEDFSPEDKFLEELKKIEGISQVETQMYTFQTL